jgi:hypothetical protein
LRVLSWNYFWFLSPFLAARMQLNQERKGYAAYAAYAFLPLSPPV